MKCPYCGEEMIRGYLMSSRDITFAVDNLTKIMRIDNFNIFQPECVPPMQSPTHSGLLRNKSALTTIAGAEPTMRKTQV